MGMKGAAASSSFERMALHRGKLCTDPNRLSLCFKHRGSAACKNYTAVWPDH